MQIVDFLIYLSYFSIFLISQIFLFLYFSYFSIFLISLFFLFLYFLYFQMKDLEDRRNDAENRADTAEDKVSIIRTLS